MIERCWTVLESTHLPQDAAAISDCKAVVTLVTSSLPTDLIGVEVAARYCNLFPISIARRRSTWRWDPSLSLGQLRLSENTQIAGIFFIPAEG